MRVLILSHYCYPEPIPKPSELAEALRERGHSVCIITGLPNYPSGVLYPGYSSWPIQKCEIQGIPAIRAYQFVYHGKNALLRILNYVSFMISAPIAALRAPASDVMYVWHPPLTVGIAAWVIARMRRIPFVYDVQDIWPESAVLSGMLREGSLMVRILSRLEKFVYRKANHLFVVTKGAKGNLERKGLPESKISVMSHWVDETLFGKPDERQRQALRQKYGWQDRFVVLFAGNIGLVQGLDSVIAAANLLRERKDIVFCLVGDGVDKARITDLVSSQNLTDTVEMSGRLSPEDASVRMSAADLLLVHLKQSDLSHYVIPTKTYAYLATGKPILMAMQGAAADLVVEAGAGVAVPPEDPQALADAVVRLQAMSAEERETMGRRGRQYLTSRFSKDNVIVEYERELASVCLPAPSHAG